MDSDGISDALEDEAEIEAELFGESVEQEPSPDFNALAPPPPTSPSPARGSPARSPARSPAEGGGIERPPADAPEEDMEMEDEMEEDDEGGVDDSARIDIDREIEERRRQEFRERHQQQAMRHEQARRENRRYRPPSADSFEVTDEEESDNEIATRMAQVASYGKDFVPGRDDSDNEETDDSASVTNDGDSAAVVQNAPRPTLSASSTFNPALLNQPNPLAPVFPHGKQSNGGWLSYKQVFGRPPAAAASSDAPMPEAPRGMIPVRAMAFNMPKSMFRPDADRMRDMRSNMHNQSRATNINALFGLLWTPVAKGWKSGQHVEDYQEAREEAAGGGGGDNGNAQDQRRKKDETVDQYMFYAHSGNSHTEVPMFVVGYEELYAEPEEGKDTTEVVGVRIWKFVFDRLHSDSHLVNKLIMENRSRLKNAGMAHCGNAKRSTKLVQEHARAVKLVGSSSTEKVALEYYAGNQYLRVTCLHDLLHLIESYGGVTDSFAGCLPIDLRSLPDGALNTPLKGHPDLGGDSYLGPEHAFCAKRDMVLRAGLVEFDSTPIRVHPDQLEPRFYFGPDGEFKIPPFLKTKNAFWFQSNPSIVHPYDMALPRPIAGIETPGKELLKLFAERENKWDPKSGTDPTIDPNLVNLFKNMCTGIDQTTAKMLREATDTIFSFDATEVSDAERREASMAKAGAAKLGTVGILGEKGSAIIEPRQVMKQLGDELSTVVRKLIAPWEEDSRAEVAKQEGTAKTTRDEDLKNAKENEILQNLARAKYKETIDGLRKESAELQKRYVRYKHELFDWGAEKFLRAFTSRYDRDSIPTGYRAVWDGLQAELKNMPQGSACIAMARDMQLTDSHKSAYSHAMNFYGRWCEHDCFVSAPPGPTRPRPSHCALTNTLPSRDSLMAATGTSWSRSSSCSSRLPRRRRRSPSSPASPARPSRCGSSASCSRSRPASSCRAATRAPAPACRATTTRKTAASSTPTR
jgi:hypothetical protein